YLSIYPQIAHFSGISKEVRPFALRHAQGSRAHSREIRWRCVESAGSNAVSTFLLSCIVLLPLNLSLRALAKQSQEQVRDCFVPFALLRVLAMTPASVIAPECNEGKQSHPKCHYENAVGNAYMRSLLVPATLFNKSGKKPK
ncbi:MAG: hypothetical protein L0Y68_07320, partial [Candidatus Dadabacteria bacterium]|nr:hypothetical protein [Candidatus Dadabacteria bacterium]